jgi:hypothetical protein
MNRQEISKSTPIKIGICYTAFLLLAMLSCIWIVGTHTILKHAGKSKPYSELRINFSYWDLLVANAKKDDSGSARIICFGDSHSFFPPDKSANEGDFNSHIPGLILKAIENHLSSKTLSISEWAYPGANITFDYYCLFFKAVRVSPDLIIIPIDWAYLGFDWIEGPQFFHPELAAFVPLYERLTSDYTNPLNTRNISLARHLGYKLNIFSLYLVGIKNWALEITKLSSLRTTQTSGFWMNPKDRAPPDKKAKDNGPKAIASSYPMIIQSSHPSISGLHALAIAAAKHEARVLFYIDPVDCEYLRTMGAFDKNAFDLSRKIIAEAIGAHEKENVFFLDLSDSLEHDYFFDSSGMHYTIEGRQRIASMLAPKILDILSKNPSSKES